MLLLNCTYCYPSMPLTGILGFSDRTNKYKNTAYEFEIYLFLGYNLKLTNSFLTGLQEEFFCFQGHTQFKVSPLFSVEEKANTLHIKIPHNTTYEFEYLFSLV